MTPEIKQVIVVRKDLKMRRGKEIAQGAHASMAFMTVRMRKFIERTRQYEAEGAAVTFAVTPAERAWLVGPFVKICVTVDSREELRDIHEAAMRAGLNSIMITDSGATEFGGIETETCCAIGPDLAEKIDLITGHLKLY